MNNPTDTLTEELWTLLQMPGHSVTREEIREIVERHIVDIIMASAPTEPTGKSVGGLDHLKPDPSTQALYDAHSGRRHTLPSGDFITVDHRGAIRQWDALGNLKTGRHTATPDLCQFATCEGAVFQDTRGVMRCTCCGRLSDPDPRTSEDAHD